MLGLVVFLIVMYLIFKEVGFVGVFVACIVYGFLCVISLINNSGR